MEFLMQHNVLCTHSFVTFTGGPDVCSVALPLQSVAQKLFVPWRWDEMLFWNTWWSWSSQGECQVKRYIYSKVLSQFSAFTWLVYKSLLHAFVIKGERRGQKPSGTFLAPWTMFLALLRYDFASAVKVDVWTHTVFYNLSEHQQSIAHRYELSWSNFSGVHRKMNIVSSNFSGVSVPYKMNTFVLIFSTSFSKKIYFSSDNFQTEWEAKILCATPL